MEIDKALYKACKDNIKLEEQIEKDKIIIAEQQIELDKYKKEIEYEQHCNEQLRNKITNLEYKIKRLEEDNKYKEVLDKIKDKTNKMIESNNSALSNPEYTIVSKHQLLKLSNEELKDILELLEELR